MERALLEWLPRGEVSALDGKHLCGSKRGEHAALQALTLAGQWLCMVLWQEVVRKGDGLTAALCLLGTMDLEDKIINADAGLLKAPFAQAVVQKGQLHWRDQGELSGIETGDGGVTAIAAGWPSPPD